MEFKGGLMRRAPVVVSKLPLGCSPSHQLVVASKAPDKTMNLIEACL